MFARARVRACVQPLWEHLGLGKAPEPEDRSPQSEPDQQAAPTVDQAGSAAAEAFLQYDTNGDGILDNEELKAMMQALGYQTNPDYLQQMIEAFGAFDGNGDGQIDVSERASEPL